MRTVLALLLLVGLAGQATADGAVRPSREGPAVVATWRREREPRALPAVVPAAPRQQAHQPAAVERPTRPPRGLFGWGFRLLGR